MTTNPAILAAETCTILLTQEATNYNESPVPFADLARDAMRDRWMGTNLVTDPAAALEIDDEVGFYVWFGKGFGNFIVRCTGPDTVTVMSNTEPMALGE